METTIRQFQEEVRDILNKDTWFVDHGIDWLAEDTLDIEYEIKKHLGQTGIVAVVTTPELTYQGEHSSTVSQKNYEEHKPESVTFTLTNNNDLSDVHEVTLNTDPTTKMVEGEKIYFSKWIDGEPIELTYGIPFPNIFATIRDNVPNGIIPPIATSRLFAFVDNTEYHTEDNPFSFGTYWTIQDEQGRTITITLVGEEDFIFVSGGCWGDFKTEFEYFDGHNEETYGDTTYSVDIVWDAENNHPKSITLHKTTGSLDDVSNAVFLDAVTVVNKGFDATISLQIVENPTVNRGKPNKDAIATAIDVAHHAVYTLAGYDSGNFNNFNPSTIRQSTVGSAGNKLLQVDARFTSTPIL